MMNLWTLAFRVKFYILVVYSTLGYKGAVETLYEEKLIEARREAQQNANYAVEGDVSIFFPVETNVDYISYTIYLIINYCMWHLPVFLIYGCCFIIFRSL